MRFPYILLGSSAASAASTASQHQPRDAVSSYSAVPSAAAPPASLLWVRGVVPSYAISESSPTSKLPLRVVPTFSVSHQQPSPASPRPHDAVSSFSAVSTSPPTMQWVCGVYAISRTLSGTAASSLNSTSLRPFLLRAVLLFHKLFFSILARACHSPHKLFSAASASTCSASSSTVLAA